MFRPVWIEIDLDKLDRNLYTIKKIVGENVKILASVKQEAYGHGLLPVAERLVKAGVEFLGLGSLEEGIFLREKNITSRILILSAALKEQARYFVEYKITPTVVSLDFAEHLNREAERRKVIFPIHIEVDTGMGRLGWWYEQAYNFIEEILRLPYLSLEGIYTHLSCADSNEEFTQYQISIFRKFLFNLHKKGINFKYAHCANSAGLLKYPDSHFNLVRPGLILYGINPYSDYSVSVEPILSLKSKVIFIKKVEKGRSIGYGRTHITEKKTTIATVAIGYGDGYPWQLSNKAKVLIKNNFFNVVGRVCMDHIMVDIGQQDNVKVGEEVTLIGGNKEGKRITVDDLAKWANTISYEIISKLSLKLPRIYYNSLQTCSTDEDIVEYTGKEASLNRG